MPKPCVFYYATLVEADAKSWAKVGSFEMEPVAQKDREPIGKPPDFCCEEMVGVSKTSVITVGFSAAGPKLVIRGESQARIISFCPFCGASIFQQNTKLRAVNITQSVETYYLEKV